MDVLLQDLRFALRSLRRSPGFTAVVVAVMALGIGVNTMIFSMVYGILFRPWPLPEPHRIVAVGQTEPKRGFDDMGISWLNYMDMRERAKSFSAFGALWDHNAVTTIDRDPERLFGASITSDLFPALGVRPILGRNFRRDEEVWGSNWNQVIISHRLWRDRFHSDPKALGKTIRVNGRVREIVGVMPPGFRYPETQDIWIPAGRDAKDDVRNDRILAGVARLKPGVTVEQADAEVKRLMAQIAREHPDQKDFSAHAHDLQQWWIKGVRPIMLVMLVAVIFVLLVACANVANLMLARAATRKREIGLRLALGASRGRVVRQLLTESVFVSVLGGILGIGLAHWGNTIWPLGIPVEKPFFMTFSIDTPVLAYTALITVFAGILFGLAPALHAAEGRLADALRDGGPQGGGSRSGRRMRATLVVAEIAFSLVLLVGAGLMIRTFVRLDQAGSRLRTDGAVTGRVLLPIATFPDEEARRVFFREMTRRLAALPNIQEVSAISHLPLGRNSWDRLVMPGERPDPKTAIGTNFATVLPGFFSLVGIPIERGRDFTDRDSPEAPKVAIVNRKLADQFWPKQDPIGRRVRFADDPDSVGWRTVVGVVANVIQNVDDHETPLMTVWVPQEQTTIQTLSFVVRGSGGTAPAASALRQVVRSMNPDVPVMELRTLREEFRFSLWINRLFTSLLGVFGAMALVIAAVGLYGVMAYSVAQRTQEIGIRMALGAESSKVVGLVVGQAMRLTLIGIGIGLAGAFALTRFMTSVLTGVSPTDPPTFTIVSVLLALSGILAAWVPAYRATRVDPMVALRYE